RCRSMTASPDRLKHELQPDDPAPEGCAVRYRITFRVFDMFPDAVHLEFHEAVQRPIHAERQRAIAGWEDRLGARVTERLVGAPRAVEPQPLVARGNLNRADPALKQRLDGLHRPFLILP